MRADPRQLTLDLFPQERRPSALERCVEWLVETCGCDEARVSPLAARLFRRFGSAEGFDRAKVLGYFYGDDAHAVPRLRACPPCLIGVDDERVDYHTVWDRCWAARWVPLREAFEVKEWRYGQYRTPYTGAPVHVWYLDNEGREVKRPYEG